MTLITLEYVLGAAVLGLLIAVISKRGQRRYPPGLDGLPIVGNLFNMPKSRNWLAYQEWGRKYGADIVSMRLLGTRMVILNTSKAAKELFDKRSSIFSDRPRAVMLNEMVGGDRAFSVMQYGDRWKQHRKKFNQHFQSGALVTHHTKMHQQVQQLLRLLHESPDDLFDHIRFTVESTIFGVVYGLQVKREGDPLLELSEQGREIGSMVLMTGVFLVDILPILKYIPAWFPGAEFKRKAAKWRANSDALFERPYSITKLAFENGKAQPCITSTMLGEPPRDEANGAIKPEELMVNVTGMAHLAGSDTVFATLTSFVLAMLLFPEVQAAAQNEIDQVVGSDRLPEIGDRESLPYVSAILKEIWRWRPPLPLGLPHRSMSDDEYDGYFIPARSIVLANTWAILHDENRYPEPDVFKPTRFLTTKGTLNPDILDPTEVFGYGRRMCPGRYFASDVVWLAMANILATFAISKPLDENGNVIEQSGEYTPGVFSTAVPFKASIKPRSSRPTDTINSYPC